MASGPVSCEAKHVFSVANKQMYSASTSIATTPTREMALRQAQTAPVASSCYSFWMVKLNVCKHICVYVLQIFPVTGFRHSFYPGTLRSVYVPLPLTHMHVLSCQSQTPQILQQLTLDPSLFLQLPQLPHSASVSCPSPKATLLVCRPVQLGTLCDCTGTCRSSLHVL